MKEKIDEILNFVSGGKKTKYIASYHTENNRVVIDWAGSMDGAKANSIMAFSGAERHPPEAELEKALAEFVRTHTIKPYTISMAYQIIRANHGIEPYPD